MSSLFHRIANTFGVVLVYFDEVVEDDTQMAEIYLAYAVSDSLIDFDNLNELLDGARLIQEIHILSSLI